MKKSKRDNDSIEEIIMNGKTYYLVNNTLSYLLSKHACVYSNILINRGTNGRVAGEDTRVMSTNLDRRTSVCRIDNHEINSILIITTSGVTITTSRENIFIFD